MRTLNEVPPASSVRPGAVILWSNPAEQTRFRLGLAGVVLAAAAVGGAVVWAASQKRRTRNYFR